MPRIRNVFPLFRPVSKPSPWVAATIDAGKTAVAADDDAGKAAVWESLGALYWERFTGLKPPPPGTDSPAYSLLTSVIDLFGETPPPDAYGITPYSGLEHLGMALGVIYEGIQFDHSRKNRDLCTVLKNSLEKCKEETSSGETNSACAYMKLLYNASCIRSG